jgi:hypothetical protein
MFFAMEIASMLVSSLGHVFSAMVDLIGAVLTIVWYMVVLYGLWQMKDVRYEAPVLDRRYTRPEWDLLSKEEKDKIIKKTITVYIDEV